MTAPWFGAVLTGGASTRMGEDKALLKLEGTAMAVRVADALRAGGAADVACVGLAVSGEHGVVDRHPGDGPLGGILTALDWAAGRGVVVVAPCDLLTPDPSAFAALAAAATSESPVAVPTVDRPLPIAVHPSALPDLRAAWVDGERSIRGAVRGIARTVVPMPQAAVADADVPEDLPSGAGRRSR